MAALAMMLGGCSAGGASSDSVKRIASFENGQPFVHAPIVLEFPDAEKQPPDPKMHVVVIKPRWNNAHPGVEKMRLVIETDDHTVRSIVSGYTKYAELVERCS